MSLQTQHYNSRYISELIQLRFYLMRLPMAELNMRIQDMFGASSYTGSPSLSEQDSQLELCRLMAERLLLNDPNVPLVREEEMAVGLRNVLEQSGTALPPDEQAALQAQMVEQLKTLVKRLAPEPDRPETDYAQAYRQYWKWIETVEALAADFQVAPQELRRRQDLRDELLRRTTTKEAYYQDLLRGLDVYNMETFGPMIDELSSWLGGAGSAESLKDIKAEMEQLVSQMRATIGQMVVTEAERVWPA